MQCQTCGNPLDQGAAFCGNCGAINAGQQAPLILPGNQAGHTAPTVVSSGLDLQSAITSDDNPYHSLVTNLKMPSLIRNDDHKRMWQEEKTATRRAWYKNNVFYVKDTGSTNVSVDLAQSVAL